MKLLKTALMASAMVIGTASMAIAQDSYGSGTKAKDAAVDKAKDVMMEKAEDAMMKEGDAMMKDKAKSYGSGAKAEDAMMKDKAKSYGSGAKAEDAMMKEKMMKEDTIKTSAPTYGSGTPATTQAPAININCPAGTTAQANGTCMITGNYVPRS